VDANVEVSVAEIYGTVNGDITATKRIEMGRVARVTGNIQAPALVIENGALFEGSCRMMEVKEAHEKRAKEEAAPPASGATSAGASGSTSGSTSGNAFSSSMSGGAMSGGAARVGSSGSSKTADGATGSDPSDLSGTASAG
jgi:hypothetical protein